MTAHAARALVRYSVAFTIGTLRLMWRVTLAMLALTVTVAAGLGIGAAIRHRRLHGGRVARPARPALPAAPVVIDTPTARLAAIDPPTVEIPVVRALPAGRHARA